MSASARRRPGTPCTGWAGWCRCPYAGLLNARTTSGPPGSGKPGPGWKDGGRTRTRGCASRTFRRPDAPAAEIDTTPGGHAVVRPAARSGPRARDAPRSPAWSAAGRAGAPGRAPGCWCTTAARVRRRAFGRGTSRSQRTAGRRQPAHRGPASRGRVTEGTTLRSPPPYPPASQPPSACATAAGAPVDVPTAHAGWGAPIPGRRSCLCRE